MSDIRLSANKHCTRGLQPGLVSTNTAIVCPNFAVNGLNNSLAFSVILSDVAVVGINCTSNLTVMFSDSSVVIINCLAPLAFSLPDLRTELGGCYSSWHVRILSGRESSATIFIGETCWDSLIT